MKILIIDDEKELLDLYEEILSHSGHDIFCTDDAREALRLIEKNSYELVITDKKMPYASGIDVINHTERFQKDEAVVYLITGDNTDEHTFKNSQSMVLKKPVSYTDLLSKINSIK